MVRTHVLPRLWAALVLFVAGAAHADAPTRIRVAFPQVGIGNRPVVGGTALATLQLQGLLEQEFKRDGIRIEWSFLRGAGPAVNELYANGLVDFSLLGDLPSIVGRASGLHTRALATLSVRGNTYVAVPSDSPIQKIEDLRGKRVAVFKGTAGQLTANKILGAHGLSERDVRSINMDAATARAALITKDVDASFGSSDYLGLRDQGAVRIIYTTKGQPPAVTSNSLFLGAEDFVRKYPEHTYRVVKVVVQAAKWLADQDNSPTKVFQLWTKSGQTFASYKEDWGGERFKYKLNPRIDAFVVARYESQLGLAKKFGLVRDTFEVERWVDRSFVDRALGELGLSAFWPERATDGSEQQAQPEHAAAAAAEPSAGGVVAVR